MVIDITDLRDPVITPAQQAALDATASVSLSFTQGAILEAAMAETGLSDFGADDFRERLDVWCQAVEEDANASSVTRVNLFQMMVRYANTRLRIGDIVKQHPEILDIQIERPIIVAGLPRSGTTHLLGLLSADTRLRSLPWWEAIAPVPTAEDAPTPEDANPRWTRADQGWAGYETLLPHMAIMHEFSADHISEDIELQAVDFSSYLLEWLAYVPRWRDYYLSHDQAGTYAYLKKGLQVLTFLRGPNRWVIKCPQHMEQLPALYRVFPDATFVITHRDPVGSIRSAMTMALYAARVLRKRVDPEEPKNYWIDRYERLLRACVRDRDILPPDQTIDVYFHQWTKDADTVLREIYRVADLPLTDATLAELHAYLAASDGGHKGKIAYNLERDFGITADEIRSRFGFYFDRFPVQPEVR
ncbi:MAG: hypothetical protein JWL66_2656 [Sphingomonadales bacterium]|nr:hypothetical protein [Sphingomonadales bacterium]